jgi:hypothetical protein
MNMIIILKYFSEQEGERRGKKYPQKLTSKNIVLLTELKQPFSN